MKVDKMIRVSLKVLPGKDLQTVLSSPKTTSIKLVDLLKKTLYGPTEDPISAEKLDDLSFIAETTPGELFKKPILVMIKQKRDDLLHAGTVVVVDGAHRLIAVNRVLMRRDEAFKDLSIEVTTYSIPGFYFEEMVSLPRLLLDPHGFFQVPETVLAWAYAVSVHNCKFSASEDANELAVIRSASEVASKWMVGKEPEAVPNHWPQQAIAHDLVVLGFIRLVSTKFLAMYSFAPKQFQETLQEIHSKGKLPKTPICDYLLRLMKTVPVTAAELLKEINENGYSDELHARIRDLLSLKPNEPMPSKRRKIKSNLTSAKYGGKKRSLDSASIVGEPPRMVREGNVSDVPSMDSTKERDDEWKPLIMGDLNDSTMDTSMDQHNLSLPATLSSLPGTSFLSGLAGLIQSNASDDRHNLSLPASSSSQSISRPSSPFQMTLRPVKPAMRQLPSHAKPATIKKKNKLAAVQTKDRWNYLLRGIPAFQKFQIVQEMEKMGVQFFPKTPCQNGYTYAWKTELKNEIKAKSRINGESDPFADEPEDPIVQEVKVVAGPGRPRKNKFNYNEFMAPQSSGFNNLDEPVGSWAARNLKLTQSAAGFSSPKPISPPKPSGAATVSGAAKFVPQATATATVVPRTVRLLPPTRFVMKPAPPPVVEENNQQLFMTVKAEANGYFIQDNISSMQNGGSSLHGGVLEAGLIKEENA